MLGEVLIKKEGFVIAEVKDDEKMIALSLEFPGKLELQVRNFLRKKAQKEDIPEIFPQSYSNSDDFFENGCYILNSEYNDKKREKMLKELEKAMEEFYCENKIQ